MAYDVTEERLKVKGSEQITRDLKVNRDAFINGKAETGSIDDKGDLKVAGEILAGDDVTISGDLYVNGTEYINDSETAQTTDNYLVLRHNQTTPLGTNEYSGVAVHNYASGKTATITTDKDGTWRVADNTETDTNYTNISYYNGTFYTGLTRTAATVTSGMKTAFDEDELDESVYYNNSYYHFDGTNWFPVSLVDNKLTLGSAVTDSATITALNALTKEDLVYFRTLTITVINPVENQPVLTRAEASDLTGGQALTWDATNQKAVGKTIDTTVTSGSSNLITSGAVKTAVDNEAIARDSAIASTIDSLDVADSPVAGKYVSSVSETDGKISVVREDLGNLTVSGVKGNAESSYRRGLVNLTPADLGAVNKAGDTITGSISRDSGGSYISGRDNAVIKQTKSNAEGQSWNPAISVKTVSGNWTMGSVGGETLQLSYDTDANYNVDNNDSSIINFPVAGSTGTLALTSQIPTANSQLTNDSGFITSAALPQNVVNVNTDIPEGVGNLSTTATAHKVTTYRNGLTIPYQMDNTNDGGILRVRGTSEDNTIFELGTWDDAGGGETIQFNYYSTDSQATPTHSVTVPKKSGTIALLSDISTNADTVDGYHADTAANGLTVAARDSNGYLNAVIFHDSYPTENINSYSSPTVMFKGNGDGYIRNTSLTDLRTALGVR